MYAKIVVSAAINASPVLPLFTLDGAVQTLVDPGNLLLIADYLEDADNTISESCLVFQIFYAGEATAGTDKKEVVLEVPPGTWNVSAVDWLAAAAVTGHNTNYFILNLIDTDADGNGSDVVATLSFTSGVDAAALTKTALTIDTAEDDVHGGDLLVLEKDAQHSSGLAMPTGMLIIELTPTAVPA